MTPLLTTSHLAARRSLLAALLSAVAVSGALDAAASSDRKQEKLLRKQLRPSVQAMKATCRSAARNAAGGIKALGNDAKRGAVDSAQAMERLCLVLDSYHDGCSGAVADAMAQFGVVADGVGADAGCLQRGAGGCGDRFLEDALASVDKSDLVVSRFVRKAQQQLCAAGIEIHRVSFDAVADLPASDSPETRYYIRDLVASGDGRVEVFVGSWPPDGVYDQVSVTAICGGVRYPGSTHYEEGVDSDDVIHLSIDGVPPGPCQFELDVQLDVPDLFSVNAGVHDVASMDVPGTTPVGPAAFQPPPGHVAVSFTADDRANGTYTTVNPAVDPPAPDPNGVPELQWKGSFQYDAATRVLTFDAAWTGPYPRLHDDGPWDAGGHEPRGATAGDKIWGVTAWVQSRLDANIEFEYGACASPCRSEANSPGWIWVGPNGEFVVDASATDPIDVEGLVIPAPGNHDFRLTVDTADLASGFDPSSPEISVKGSFTGWHWIDLTDDGSASGDTPGDGTYTATMSDLWGTGTQRHQGKLSSGDVAEFVFVLDGKEYKHPNGVAATQGVTISASPDGDSNWYPLQLVPQTTGRGNTEVVIPSSGN